MKVAVIGTGYVGLVTGSCLAEVGNTVTCVDIDKEKVQKLRDGIIPIYEPGLEPIVKSNVAAGRLQFTTDTAEAVRNCQIIMIAVGTPPNEDGSADVKHVLKVAEDIGHLLEDYRLVITKSTVPVGTADKVKAAIQKSLTARGKQIAFSVASNPEFLKEGAAVSDFMKPDRIVVGCEDERARKLLTDLYAHFVKNGFQFFAMDLRSAELCKYASNAMLATKISFMNELSRISEKMGADITSVRLGMGADQRIGYQFTHPGLGYGGSCFPKDVKALVSSAKSLGLQAELLDAVEDVNKVQRELFFQKIMNHFKGQVGGRTFAIWGLSFKPDTDDIREAPALDIARWLMDVGATVVGYDPIAMPNVKAELKEYPAFKTVNGAYDALQDADALILCTEWKPFRSPDFDKMKGLLRTPVIFDGRNQYTPEKMEELGFDYYSVGRVPVLAASSK